MRWRDEELRSDSFQHGLGTFWIPLAGQKCSFDYVFRHLALFSRAGFKIKGEIQRVFTMLNQIFHALNWVTAFGAFEIVTSSIKMVFDFFMRNYKNNGFFPVCKYIWSFRTSLKLVWEEKWSWSGCWPHQPHKSQRGLKENKYRNFKYFSQMNEKSFVILTVQKFNLKYIWMLKSEVHFLVIICRTLKGKWVNLLAQWPS